MEPVDFIKEMNGIVKVIGPDEVPTASQWKAIHDMMGEAMAYLVKKKIEELEYAKQLRDNPPNPFHGGYTYAHHSYIPNTVITSTVKNSQGIGVALPSLGSGGLTAMGNITITTE